MGRLNDYRTHITAVLAALIIVGGVVLLVQRPQPAPIVVHKEAAAEATVDEIAVYVSGAVASPGVYSLETGDRIEDAVAAAGGPAADADLSGINLARLLADEMQVNVPRQGEQPAQAVAALQPPGEQLPVNINSAAVQELESLPGIGPEYAKRIVQFREENGPFQTIEELKKVPGIGEKRFVQLKELITVK